ncbi:MAG: MerR family transcriptional regulator, light-induced transcriptional regulator [Solirubrobacteraceae bacterium]|jgi:DNA-binding transcriptional MerR regulator|nr:MerR family transcriptional regulator, light-induced transcriptional regulator [Solirubrobacteraceae bacterium]
MSEGDDRWRIKEFAEIVGVQEATLRAWERRYELLRPERSSGGFRLYSRADERRIRSMQAHMARGIAPAQAAALALAEPEVAAVAPADPSELVGALLAATERFEATRFDALLDAALAGGHLPGVRDVVLPVLVQIGLRWERGELTVGHEHFASHLIERRLLALARGWEEGAGPLALLACPSGERHTLGLVCFGLALADCGWRIAYLGADTPIDQISDVSASLRPAAVVLCSRDPRHLSAGAAAIADLGARHHTILAGDGASAALARRLGVRHAAGDPTTTALALAERPPA